MEQLERAYQAGLDCGKNGPNITNCDLALFATPEMTRAWERGKADGETKEAPR